MSPYICKLPLQKSQEKRGTPEKPGDPSFLRFPQLFFFFLTLESLEKPGRHGNSFLERPECSSKKSLESQERALGLRGKCGVCPSKPNPEKPGKPGKPGMTVPGVEISGFHGQAGNAYSWKAKKARRKNPGLPGKLRILY